MLDNNNTGRKTIKKYLIIAVIIFFSVIAIGFVLTNFPALFLHAAG